MTLSKWCEAMEAATKLGLPWRLLRDKLAPPEADRPATEVTYRRTLDMLDDDLIVSLVRLSIRLSGFISVPESGSDRNSLPTHTFDWHSGPLLLQRAAD